MPVHIAQTVVSGLLQYLDEILLLRTGLEIAHLLHLIPDQTRVRLLDDVGDVLRGMIIVHIKDP